MNNGVSAGVARSGTRHRHTHEGREPNSAVFWFRCENFFIMRRETLTGLKIRLLFKTELN